MTHNPIASFADLVDLANEKLGGAAIACSDDFFAGMDNLVKAKEAVWDEDAYTDRGKWMDGWESKRAHKENDDAVAAQGGHSDWCIVRLGAPGIVRGVVVDTAFFRGNFPSHAALDGISVEGFPSAHEIAARTDWVQLLEKSPLEGNAKNSFAVSSHHRFTHVRLRIFPDGGVARLRIFGEPLPDWRMHGGLDGELELSSTELGGVVVACSDMFFGSRHNLLYPAPSLGMHDGWETRRSRRAGFDWAVVKLGARGHINRIVVDTAHFKGNCPESFALDGAINFEGDTTTWAELFPRTKLQPDTKHVFTAGLASADRCGVVRLRIYPDGGVARLRLFGRLLDDEKAAQRARRLSAMTESEAESALRSCCASSTWVKKMLAARPFLSAHAVDEAMRTAFNALVADDWLEAFRAHPRIGGKKPEADATTTTTSKSWSNDEQRGVSAADDAIKARLATLNDAYFEKNGFIFIVKATGKSASEMLAVLEERLKNERPVEIDNAAVEQRKITELRLQKLC